MAKLGVNIDHVATLREARKGEMPDPIEAAHIAEEAGCDSIVCHLREDRRHIKDSDAITLRETVRTRLNLEMSVAKSIVDFACRLRPDQATLVPERRQEITTEGGLDVNRNLKRVTAVVTRLQAAGIEVSLFINPSKAQLDASRRAGAGIVELHTGEYANAGTKASRRRQLENLRKMTTYGRRIGLEVNAGHGLDYENTKAVAAIPGMNELNIGHAIISRAVFTGLGRAVEEMVRLAK